MHPARGVHPSGSVYLSGFPLIEDNCALFRVRANDEHAGGAPYSSMSKSHQMAYLNFAPRAGDAFLLS